jgi:chromosomal replication initiator protein
VESVAGTVRDARRSGVAVADQNSISEQPQPELQPEPRLSRQQPIEPIQLVAQAQPIDPAQPIDQAQPVDVAQPVDPVLQWTRVRARLRQEVGDVEYRAWLRQMSLGHLDGDEVTLLLPSRFLRDWVRGRFGNRLNVLWQAENPDVRCVEIRVGKGDVVDESDGATGLAARLGERPAVPPMSPRNGRSARGEADKNDSHPESRSESSRGESSRGESKLDLSAPLDPRFSFENFVVGKPNEFAYACARRVAEQLASPGFNPLFLYGGVGLGKTHLMHAIGLELSAGGRATVAYMSAEKFMYRFIAAIRSQNTIEFKDQLRSVDVLMIDDLQFLIGKDNTQEEFFHTFNAMVDAGRQIVVSSDKSPSDLSGLEDRLRTRLGWGMVADLHATTFELRISILESKAARANAAVPHKVMEFLAHKITTNVRELEGALNRLIAHASLFDRPITLEATQEVLHDVLKAHDRRVTIDEIQRRVVEHYHLRMGDMSSSRRARAVARPRQVAMFLAKQLTSRSLPEIGKKFGDRDHTTVMHAIARVQELMERDVDFAENVELLRRMLES